MCVYIYAYCSRRTYSQEPTTHAVANSILGHIIATVLSVLTLCLSLYLIQDDHHSSLIYILVRIYHMQMLFVMFCLNFLFPALNASCFNEPQVSFT